MSPEAAPLPPSLSVRCDHCGRAVRETKHTRSSYRVDYYVLHTGDVQPSTLMTDDERRSITFQKLVRVVDVITCVDCYRDPAVQRQREERFRPEVLTEERIERGA